MEPTEIVNVVQFRKFVIHAEPGKRCFYYRGHLFRDRGMKEAYQNGIDRSSVIELADFALYLQRRGLVDLVQKRHGDDDYSYLAIRTSEPAGHIPDKLTQILEAA